ncbi:hypothetical protein D1007_31012 [Hordeum vulgare]|nr:hypothetical protein D1007_31012 [Hordeum vulgare]
MADTRRVRAKRWVTRVTQAVPVGHNSHERRHSVGEVTGATTDPAGREQRYSSFHPSMQQEGRTAMASSSHTRLEHVNAQAMLPMARQLLRYRSTDAGYDA